MRVRTFICLLICEALSQGVFAQAKGKGPELGSEWKVPDAGTLATMPHPVVPRIDLQQDMSNPAKSKLDIEALMQKYQAQPQKARTQAPGEGRPQGLLAFVSFSMPEESLKKIIQQASTCGGVLILRGFHERSLAKTAAKIKAVMGDAKVAWKIDPKSFTAYQISAVPSYVLTAPPSLSDGSYAKQVGDVTIESFLDAVQLQDKQLAPLAKTYLKKIRGAV